MKVSLKEARRIERRINSNGLRKGYPLRATINIYDNGNLPVAIDTANNKALDSVVATIALTNARSALRRMIQQTNETSGINELISARETHIQCITVWSDVRETSEDVKDPTIVIRTIEAMRKRADTGSTEAYYTRNDNVDFIAISDGLRKIATHEVRNCQRMIDECDDKLAMLNATTKIEIPEDIKVLLEEHEVI